MKVLIACEESGTVREAFRNKGHDAWSCDILPTRIKGNHIEDDVLKYLDEDWDIIIAHPPCTYLTNAAACRLYPSKGKIDVIRYKKGLEAKEFFLKFYNNKCNKIAIENPISSKVFNLPKYTQEIQPYEFGHPVSKKTRLWLKGLPKLIPTNIVKKESTFLPSNTSKTKGTGVNSGKPRGIDRSKTFEGIANAMANQWG